MTETSKNSGDKLSVSSTKTLTLKRGGVEQGVVRQSFSHRPLHRPPPPVRLRQSPASCCVR